VSEVVLPIAFYISAARRRVFIAADRRDVSTRKRRLDHSHSSDYLNEEPPNSSLHLDEAQLMSFRGK
jgi:hypothetical protein